jgi:hypothetical protein
MTEFEKYNIITLNDGRMYVICEELDKNNTKYLLLTLTDENENILEDSMVVKLLETEDHKFHLGGLDENDTDDLEAKKEIIIKFKDSTLNE